MVRAPSAWADLAAGLRRISEPPTRPPNRLPSVPDRLRVVSEPVEEKPVFAAPFTEEATAEACRPSAFAPGDRCRDPGGLSGLGGYSLASREEESGWHMRLRHLRTVTRQTSPSPSATAGASPSSGRRDRLRECTGFAGSAIVGASHSGGQRSCWWSPEQVVVHVPRDGWRYPMSRTTGDHVYRFVRRSRLRQRHRRSWSGWPDVRGVALGSGGSATAANWDSDDFPTAQPVKQSPVTIAGHVGYLALYHVRPRPSVDSYCGVVGSCRTRTRMCCPSCSLPEHSAGAPSSR